MYELLVLAGLMMAATALVVTRRLSVDGAEISGPETSASSGRANTAEMRRPEEIDAASHTAGAARSRAGDELRIAVDVGRHRIEDFDPATDWIVIEIPQAARNVRHHPADKSVDVQPTLAWDQADGTVEIQFGDLVDVPLTRIELLFGTGADRVPLATFLSMQEKDALGSKDLRIDPQSDRDGGDIGIEGAQMIAMLGEVDMASPVNPEDRVDPFLEGSVDLSRAVPQNRDAATDNVDGVTVVSGFVPGDDLIALDADKAARITFTTLPDGSRTDLYVNGDLVARVPGVAELTLDDVVVGFPNNPTMPAQFQTSGAVA